MPRLDQFGAAFLAAPHAGVLGGAALLAFPGVDVSLIVLRYRAPSRRRPFRVPLAVGRFPVLAGAASLLARKR